MDDTLTIDIESTNEASSGIDSLIAKLEALKVRVNENLKAIGRLNSALIQLGANSKSINLGNINAPTISGINQPQAPTPIVDSSALVKSQTDAQQAISKTSNEANIAGRSVDDLSDEGEKSGEEIEDGANRGSRAISRLGNQARKSSGFFSKLANMGLQLGKAFALSPFKWFGKTLVQSRSAIQDMGSSVDSLVKKLKMTTLALLGARGAFTAIRKAVNAYMQYDTALSKTLQNNWAVLGSLIAPIIERLIALFSTLISYIATFIKMLTGVDLVARANAKALKNQASGASGASKAVKDLSDELGNLQKFDDLNVVDFPKDTGGSSGGGAGAGLPALTIEDIDIKPLEKFLDFIRRNDWYGLGMEIARKFNDGLRLIDFEWLEEKARQWGKNMGDLFNGLTDGTDWGLVGEKIAGGLNTAMGFVNTFFDTYNFDHLGQGLATGINGIVNTVHWEDVGQMIVNKFNAIVETLDAFVSTLNFNNLGQALGTAFESAMLKIDFGKVFAIIGKGIAGIGRTLSGFLTNVDWGKFAKDFSEKLKNGLKEGAKAIQEFDWSNLGDDFANALKDWIANFDREGVTSAFAEFLGSALGAVISFLGSALENLVASIWDGIKSYFGQYIEEYDLGYEGFNIVAGILKGIDEGIVNIANWIYDNMFKPFIDGFKKAFGINSPSTVMKEQGQFIIEGLFEGLKGLWDKVKGVFTDFRDKIKDKFSEIKSDIQDKIEDTINTIKTKFSWENVKLTFETIKTKLAEKFRDVRDDIKTKMKEAVDKLKSFFTWDNIKTTFETLITKIKNKFSEIGTTVGTVLSSKFNEIVSKIINKAVDAINGFIRALNKVVDTLNKIPKVSLSKLSEIDYPKLETGTNKIQVEGLYHLHEGEAVVPKKYNPAINNKMYSENNTQMLSKMDTLIDLLNNLEMTNVVNVGNDQLYKGTVKYINRQRNIYGTDVV